MYKHVIKLEFDQSESNYKKPIPVRFRIDDLELLGRNLADNTIDPWYKTWVHSFATSGLFVLFVSHSENGAEINLYGDTSLWFRTIGKSVLIHSSVNDLQIRVNFSDLYSAWGEFARKVKNVVLKYHPEMASYSRWDIVDNTRQYCINFLKEPFVNADDNLFQDDDTVRL